MTGGTIGDSINLVFGTIALGTSLWEVRQPTGPASWLGFRAVMFGGAAICLTIQFPAASAAYGSAAAINAWMWWKRRPPRKRRPSKALATIRDLGHRLVVTS